MVRLRSFLLNKSKASASAARKVERKLKLILLVALKHVADCIAYEPGERHTVFFGQFGQLSVILFIDRDRDPSCQFVLPPGSRSRARPPKRCITVVNGTAT